MAGKRKRKLTFERRAPVEISRSVKESKPHKKELFQFSPLRRCPAWVQELGSETVGFGSPVEFRDVRKRRAS
jgi:hypothetical protein